MICHITRIVLFSLDADGAAVDLKSRHLYVVDEIGEMGLFSRGFVSNLRVLFHHGTQPPPKHRKLDRVVVLATFPVSGQTHKLMKELRSREDCTLFEVRALAHVLA